MKKIFNIILLCLLAQWTWAQSGEGYDPQNPGDPDVYYRLMVEASPLTGGTVNPTKKSLATGETVWVSASPRLGYTFKQWMDGDKIVSKEKEFQYTMPSNDVVLTAHFDYVGNEGYNPENPGDPFADGYQHKVTLYATPSAGGSFNSSSFYLTEGKATDVYAYPRNGYRFVSWKQNGKIVSTQNPMEITMGTENLEYTAQFVYDPVSPANPGANSFNASTGELVVDDFESGRLNSAIYSALGSDDNYNKVKSITIIGRMQAEDFGFIKGMTNCAVVDISRTTGYNHVPDNAFEGASALKTLILPYSVESIGNYAFSGCSNLATLYCYSTTPPSVSSTTFDGVPSSMKVLVPALSLELYQSANYWKNFVLSALDGVTNTLTISLPEDAKDGRYKNMTLELDNITSGQVSRMLITDRTRYSFVNLIHNTKYNVYVKTAKSVVLGEILDVEIVDRDVETAFAQLKQPQTVTMSVVNGKGEDLTESSVITWMDEKGSYLATGNSISGYVDGTNLKYKIKLSNEAALNYVAPQDSTYTIKDSDNDFACVLTPLELITVTGYVKNVNTKRGIYDASVSISQQTSGKQSRTVVAKTDTNGKFTAEVYNSPASISCAAFDYVNKSVEVESFVVAVDGVTMEDIMMNSVVGATVNVSLTYQESVPEGDTPEIQDWYNDYQNLSLSVFNLTTNLEVTQISNRYPQFVLMDGVRVGDELRLTLSSKKSAFTPVVIDKKVDETEEINALFAIKQYGGMHASYQTTTNDAVVGILYDTNGYLQQKSDFANDNTLTFNGLKDGDYTLITMGKNDSYNSIYNIARLRDAGLTENSDYSKSIVTIESGIIRNINIANVPFLNIAKFHTIDKEKSSLSVNKSSIVAGNYLTFTGVVELQDENITITDNMSLVVDIPSSASFVKGSVMVGDKVVDNYTFVDNTLTVPFNNFGLQNKIKFCVIPTIEGTYQPNAMVGFKANGEDVMIPLQSSDYVVKAISINVPLKTSKDEICVSGTAVQGSTVEVYDDETLIGTSRVDKTGEWKINCLLEKPYNSSYHNIYAIINNENVKIISSVKKCWYERYAITAKTVAMSFYNTWLYGGSTVEVLFDLENKKITNPHYMFYTNAEFSFAADLTNNDPDVVESVIIRVYTRENRWVNIKTQYDANIDRWIGRHQFGWNNVPVAVSVEVNTNPNNQPLIDEQQITDIRYDITTISSEMSDAIRRIEEQSDSLITPDEYEILLAEITNEDIDNHDGLTEEYLESLSDAELEELISQYEDGDIEESQYLSIDFYKDFFNGSQYFDKTLPDGTIIQSVFCDNVNRDSLIASGFTEYLTTEGQIFFKETNCQSEFIDVQQKLHIFLYRNTQGYDSENLKARRAATGIDKFNEIIGNINSFYQPIANAYVKTEENLHVFSQYFENQISKIKAELPKARTRFYMKEVKLKRLEQELTKTTDLTDYLAKQREIELYKIQVDKAKFTLNNLNTRYFLAKKAFSVAKYLPKLFRKSIPLTKYGDIIADGLTVVRTFQRAYLSIPDPCKDDEEKAQQCKELCIASAIYCEEFVALKAGASAALDLATVGQFAAAPETGGVTAASALGTMILNISANLVVDFIVRRHNEAVERQVNEIINSLKCIDKCPICKKKPCECCNICQKYPCECEPEPKSDPQHDPSGYVYEGIFNNRIEGVTTTCYQKLQVEDIYGDLHDNIVKWDAEEYGQENPLHTDKDGFYQWFVPEGLWQVKYEKEGYETAYSEWLPVPPPQLDVNIGIVQNRQPEVKEAHAYEDGVELTFDKYMIPAYLTTDNIKVSQNGKYVDGKVILVDEEVAYRDENVKYASTVRFVPNTAFSASKDVTLVVANKVKSYAGIQMAENFTQSFDIEKEVKNIVADSLVKVPYQGNKVITLYVQPADAAVGKNMHAESSSEMIASLTKKDIVIDENGMAQFEIKGELPGTTGITFSIEGVKATATVIANIGDFEVSAVNEPKASLVSGSSVYRGTTVKLTADSKDLKIWYTTDGTCPCDENGSRKQYKEPIIINDNVTIKAIAENTEGESSDVATFIYSILQSKAGVSLNNGWTWVSFNMKNDALTSVNTAMASGTWTSEDAIKDNKYVDMYSANQKLWIGTLSKHGALSNAQMYKVHSSKVQTLGLTGEAVHPAEMPITVGSGWNYISYLPLTNMSVAEALRDYKAENGDVIKSQDAFAIYSATNGWEGDLTTMTVGRGYMLKRGVNASQSNFTYPVATSGVYAMPAVSPAKSYSYADNMNIVGQIEGVTIENGDSIVALVKGEIRGAARVDRNNKVFLTIHGDKDADVAIVLLRDGDIIATAENIVGYQNDKVIGSSDKPTVITFANENNNAEGDYGNIKAIYQVNGMRLGTKRLSSLPTGTYIVYSEKNGKTQVSKFNKR